MRTYRDYIYDLCSSVDMDDKADVTLTLQILAKDAVRSNEQCVIQDKKLQEIMSYADYKEWTTKQAREWIKEDIAEMADSEFKDFIIENMGAIIGEDADEDGEGRSDEAGAHAAD